MNSIHSQESQGLSSSENLLLFGGMVGSSLLSAYLMPSLQLRAKMALFGVATTVAALPFVFPPSSSSRYVSALSLCALGSLLIGWKLIPIKNALQKIWQLGWKGETLLIPPIKALLWSSPYTAVGLSAIEWGSNLIFKEPLALAQAQNHHAMCLALQKGDWEGAWNSTKRAFSLDAATLEREKAEVARRMKVGHLMPRDCDLSAWTEEMWTASNIQHVAFFSGKGNLPAITLESWKRAFRERGECKETFSLGKQQHAAFQQELKELLQTLPEHPQGFITKDSWLGKEGSEAGVCKKIINQYVASLINSPPSELKSQAMHQLLNWEEKAKRLEEKIRKHLPLRDLMVQLTSDPTIWRDLHSRQDRLWLKWQGQEVLQNLQGMLQEINAQKGALLRGSPALDLEEDPDGAFIRLVGIAGGDQEKIHNIKAAIANYTLKDDRTPDEAKWYTTCLDNLGKMGLSSEEIAERVIAAPYIRMQQEGVEKKEIPIFILLYRNRLWSLIQQTAQPISQDQVAYQKLLGGSPRLQEGTLREIIDRCLAVQKALPSTKAREDLSQQKKRMNFLQEVGITSSVVKNLKKIAREEDFPFSTLLDIYLNGALFYIHSNRQSAAPPNATEREDQEGTLSATSAGGVSKARPTSSNPVKGLREVHALATNGIYFLGLGALALQMGKAHPLLFGTAAVVGSLHSAMSVMQERSGWRTASRNFFTAPSFSQKPPSLWDTLEIAIDFGCLASLASGFLLGHRGGIGFSSLWVGSLLTRSVGSILPDTII